MPQSLNNVTTAAAYAAAATVSQYSTTRVNIQVYNAAVYWQFALPGQPGQWQPEEFLAAGRYSFDRACSAARFRSAVATAAAQVTCTLLTDIDTGG